MREDLLGYLLGALEPDEEREIEDRLEADPELRKKLRVIRRGLEPLSSDDGLIDAPEGLAARACGFVDRAPEFAGLGTGEARTPLAGMPADGSAASETAHAPGSISRPAAAKPAPSTNGAGVIDATATPFTSSASAAPSDEPVASSLFVVRPAQAGLLPSAALSPVSNFEAAPSGRRWSMADALVTAGVVAAASMLVLPALSAGRYQAQVTACGERLHRLGTAMIDYSRIHGGLFPEVVQQGPMSRAGIFPVRLREAKLIDDYADVTCPAAHHDAHADVGALLPTDEGEASLRIPEPAELATADEAQVDALLTRSRGVYGYALGYVDDSGYQLRRNHNRSTFIVLSDLPHDGKSGSRNHGCGGQNVWFEDGHVEFLNTCRLKHLEDQIFENRRGFVGAGVGPDDIVIGRPTDRPLITPVGFSQ